MTRFTKCLASAGLLTLAAVSPAEAAAILHYLGASGAGLGSVGSVTIDHHDRTVSLAKTFGAMAPIRLDFRVTHGKGPGSPYRFSEMVTNATGTAWTDFHFSFDNANPAIHFASFFTPRKTYFADFRLAFPPASTPYSLTFLAGAGDEVTPGETVMAGFKLHLPDPGKIHDYTFSLIQRPTGDGDNGGAPGPGLPAPGLPGLFGLALAALGLIRRRIC